MGKQQANYRKASTSCSYPGWLSLQHEKSRGHGQPQDHVITLRTGAVGREDSRRERTAEGRGDKQLTQQSHIRRQPTRGNCYVMVMWVAGADFALATQNTTGARFYLRHLLWILWSKEENTVQLCEVPLGRQRTVMATEIPGGCGCHHVRPARHRVGGPASGCREPQASQGWPLGFRLQFLPQVKQVESGCESSFKN